MTPHKGGRTKPWITEQQRYAYTGGPTTTCQVDTAYERIIAENVCSRLSTCIDSYAQESPHKICIKSRSPGSRIRPAAVRRPTAVGGGQTKQSGPEGTSLLSGKSWSNRVTSVEW